MPRFPRAGVVLLLLLLAIAGTWWLTQTETPYPTSKSVTTLQDTVSIRWTDEGLAAVETDGPLDALAGLGYVHGTTRGWIATLWRQTARGRLGRWFGKGVLPIDRHVRRLGLAHQARRAYEQLSPPERRPLDAYAHGLNAALQSERVRQQDAFVLHEVTPDPWKPWHTLAVERLLAWLATPPLDAPFDGPANVTRFQHNDDLLRRWLHIHGWERSVAWAVRSRPASGDSQTALFQRHVLGATAAPVLQDIRLNRRGARPLGGTTLPGVPLVLTGSRGEEAWTSLLRSTARLRQVPFDSTDVRRRYERLHPAGGDEQLLRIRRLDGGVLLDRTDGKPPSSGSTGRPDTTRPAPRTAWVLRWPGLSAATDIPAWLRRAHLASDPDTTGFQLFDADGLRVSQQGKWTVLGEPSVVIRDSVQRLIIGQTHWARHQAQSLRAHHGTGQSLAVQDWSASDSSTWAAAFRPRLQPALDRLETTHPEFQNVATYLRNWNSSYDPSSIGATLFDRWMREYRADLGRVPQPSAPPAYFSTYRQHRGLLHALDTLRARFGPDVRRWRWERAVPDRRFFPVWSADSLVNDDLQDLGTTQYAPLERNGRGHPSALAGGPSLVDPSPTAPSPTVWEGWTTSAGSTFTVRRHDYDPTATFARTRIRRSRPPAIHLSPDSASYETTLLPTSE